jgi:hypothetical protein
MTNILANPARDGKPDDRPWWTLIVLPAFLPLLLLPYLARDTWSAGGSGNWLADFLATPGFYVLAVALLVLVALVSRRSRLRRFRGTMAWFGLTLLLATMAGQILSDNIRDDALKRLSRTAAPLVKAIGAYEARRGRAPETLEALIPDFLAALPATGIPAAQAWQYQAFAPDHSGGDSWWLSARLGLIGEVTFHPESDCAPTACATGGKWRYWQW